MGTRKRLEGKALTRGSSAGTEGAAKRIAAHLARVQRCTTSEERLLDRDGDGVLTARDLLLARRDERPGAMPVLKPSSRRVESPGALTIDVLGTALDRASAFLRIAGRRHEIELEIDAKKGRQRFAIRIPAGLAAARPVDAEFWMLAKGVTPRRLRLVLVSPTRRPARHA